MIEGNGPKWLFDIDSLTQSMNYVPVVAGTIINESVGTQEELNAGTSEEISQDCIVMPIWKDASYFDSPTQNVDNGEPKSIGDDQKQDGDGPDNENDEQDKYDDVSSPKEVNVVGQHVNTSSLDVNTGSSILNTVDPSVNTASSYAPDSPKDMFKIGASHTLKATHVEFFSDEDEPKVDLGNILNSYIVPTTPNTRIHKGHLITNVIGDVKSFIQTRRMTKPTSEQGFLSAVYEQKTHDTLNTCLYACFLSHIKPISIAKALFDSSWVEAMQEELLQFKLQQVWILVDFPIRKRAIGTKWVFINKKDERGIVIRNKSRIEAIRLFLAYASFMGFLVYQMDVKSAFLYVTIEEEVYVTQPPGFKDLDHPDKVYKVVKALYGLHQAPRAWYETLANYLLGNRFKRGKIDHTLFIKKQKGDILLVQVYVDHIIFGSTNKELCTAFEKVVQQSGIQTEKGVQLQAEQSDWLVDTDEEIYEQELEAHYNYMTKIQEVPNANSGTDSEPLEQLDVEMKIKDFKSNERRANATLTQEISRNNLKNDTVCKEKASNVFQKEREQYLEIQDLKAQLQDKNIAICELKKLIEKCKGKSVETKFDKPSIVRQPNAQRIPKPSVLGKPAPFSDSLERKIFSKKKSVPKTNESEGLSKPVTLQNLPQTATQAVRNTNVIKPGMYRIKSRTTQNRAPQLPQTYRNTNPHVSTSTGVTHRTNVSRPQTRNTQMKDKVMPNISQVKYKKTEVEDHHRISSISNQTKSVTACNDSLKSRTSNVNAVCATCGKCVFNSNHDACVSKYLNDVNARTKKPKVVPISTRKPKSQGNKSVATHRYGDLVQGNITINKVYYVEGLNHNLFSVGQFCDADLEVAFRKSMCFGRDLQGNDLLTGNRGSNLYTISL
ncbi:retrovirus-related pol polyprotein from transposon TNT 1-94 [Tanacetum coccineum]